MVGMSAALLIHHQRYQELKTGRRPQWCTRLPYPRCHTRTSFSMEERAHVQYYLSVFALNLTLWFWRWRCSGANTHRVLRAFDSAGPSLVCAFGAARLPRNVWNEATACTWFARRGAACVRAVSADVPTRRQKGGLHQTCLVVRGT
jgi:hypothetical protein